MGKFGSAILWGAFAGFVSDLAAGLLILMYANMNAVTTWPAPEMILAMFSLFFLLGFIGAALVAWHDAGTPAGDSDFER